MGYIKSPFNYIGNKYRVLSQLLPLFPPHIDIMVDLFCGGADVAVNTPATRVIANDINLYLINIFNEFKSVGLERSLAAIDDTIARWGLNKTDDAAYAAFRAHYNATRRPLDLFVLICFSFNHQFRYNAQHEFNTPFGRARSSFTPTMRRNLCAMYPELQRIEFVAREFTELDLSTLTPRDFVYADPPYLLTCGSYNDGKRGFKGWSAQDDAALMELLTHLDAQGVPFALSNVLTHKGRRHTGLARWAQVHGYHVHNVQLDYNNCNYHTKNKDNATQEVLITNYA